MTNKDVIPLSLYTSISTVIQQARQHVKQAVNQQVVKAYCYINQFYCAFLKRDALRLELRRSPYKLLGGKEKQVVEQEAQNKPYHKARCFQFLTVIVCPERCI